MFRSAEALPDPEPAADPNPEADAHYGYYGYGQGLHLQKLDLCFDTFKNTFSFQVAGMLLTMATLGPTTMVTTGAKVIRSRLLELETQKTATTAFRRTTQ